MAAWAIGNHSLDRLEYSIGAGWIIYLTFKSGVRSPPKHTYKREPIKVLPMPPKVSTITFGLVDVLISMKLQDKEGTLKGEIPGKIAKQE